MTDADAPNDFDGLVFKGLSDAYTQQPPATLAEIGALLASFERHKQRLVVPTARVEEFEAAVRAGGMGHAMTVVGHPWLKEDQVFLAASEAQIEDGVKAAVLAYIRANLEELTEAAGAQLCAKLEAEAERDRWQLMFQPRRLTWPSRIGPPGV